MRARVAGAMVGAMALLCALVPSSAGAETALTAPMSVTGRVAASWHGAPARGCAEAGLCGYHGAVATGASDDSQFQIEGSHGHPRFVYAYANLNSSSVVRVVRGDDACVDTAPVQELDASGVVRHGRVRFVLSTYGLSSGRCAGPDASEFVERLPERTVSLARLRRGGVTLDFSGRVPYGSGRFAGTIRSTLKMRIGRATVRHFQSAFTPHGGRGHFHPYTLVRVRAVYRVAGFQGSVSSAFHGTREPFCVTVDSCGSRGTSGWAIFSTAGGTLEFDGEARARRGDRGLRGAVAAIERGESFDGYTYSAFRHAVGATTADVHLPDGSRCHDASRAAAPGVAAESSGRRIQFALGGEDDISAIDLLHVGCPGPVGTDIFGRRALASRSLPAVALLRQRLAVSLRSSGSFHSFGYAGTRRARFGLRLRRVSVEAHYRRVTR